MLPMDNILEISLVLMIVAVTLAFGGVEPGAFTLMEVVMSLAVLLHLLRQTREGKFSLPIPRWPVFFILLALLQVIPLPSKFIESLSPARLMSLDLAGVSPVKGVWTTLSIYPHDTVLALVKILAYVGSFMLAAYLFDSRKGKSNLVRGLIYLGCFEAAYGTVQYLTGLHKIFAYTKQYDLEEATGTYINRNHFAGLLELTMPFVLGSIFYHYQLWSERRRAGGDRRTAAARSSAGIRSIFYLFLLLIMAVGVVLSRSRMGILAVVFSIVFVAMLAQFKTRQRIWMLGVFLFLVCVAGYGLWIGLDPVLSRFEEMRNPNYLRMEGRVSFWTASLQMIRDYPLFGSGLGTFPIAFRRYQTEMVDTFVDHAHSDYLEFTSETGLLGGALLFLPILYLLGRMVVSFLGDPRRYRRAVTLSCIGSTLALLLHSFTDFNLQIPANALIFSAVLGIGYKASCIERTNEERVPVSPNRPSQGERLKRPRAQPTLL